MPIEFFRGVLGAACVFFAYMAGRVLPAFRKGEVKRSRFYGWLLRTVVCALAVLLRAGADAMAIGVWVLAAAAFALAYRTRSHEKPPEDLTHQIFPE